MHSAVTQTNDSCSSSYNFGIILYLAMCVLLYFRVHMLVDILNIRKYTIGAKQKSTQLHKKFCDIPLFLFDCHGAYSMLYYTE